MKRKLSYWKGQKVFWRDCIAAADTRSSYWWLVRKEYRLASRKVEQAERKVLIRHL